MGPCNRVSHTRGRADSSQGAPGQTISPLDRRVPWTAMVRLAAAFLGGGRPPAGSWGSRPDLGPLLARSGSHSSPASLSGALTRDTWGLPGSLQGVSVLSPPPSVSQVAGPKPKKDPSMQRGSAGSWTSSRTFWIRPGQLLQSLSLSVAQYETPQTLLDPHVRGHLLGAVLQVSATGLILRRPCPAPGLQRQDPGPGTRRRHGGLRRPAGWAAGTSGLPGARGLRTVSWGDAPLRGLQASTSEALLAQVLVGSCSAPRPVAGVSLQECRRRSVAARLTRPRSEVSV